MDTLATNQVYPSRRPYDSVERPRASSEDSWSHHQLCVPILLGDPPLVHRTYGIHTCITNTQLDWFILNGLFQDRSCLTIGKCSLDYTAEDIDKQQVFRRQVQMAMLLEKPLVLHLRGGEYEGAVIKDEGVYEQVYRMLMGELQLPRSILSISIVTWVVGRCA